MEDGKGTSSNHAAKDTEYQMKDSEYFSFF